MQSPRVFHHLCLSSVCQQMFLWFHPVTCVLDLVLVPIVPVCLLVVLCVCGIVPPASSSLYRSSLLVHVLRSMSSTARIPSAAFRLQLLHPYEMQTPWLLQGSEVVDSISIRWSCHSVPSMLALSSLLCPSRTSRPMSPGS